MGDKRRYVRRDPGTARDKVKLITDAGEDTGDAAKDGFSIRYRNPTGKRASGYGADNLYREKYNCDGLMDEDEARYTNMRGYPD